MQLGTDGKPRGTVVTELKPIRAEFGADRVVDVARWRIEAFIRGRQGDRMAPGSIRNSVAYLRAAMRLVMKRDRLFRIPYFPTVKLENTRLVFFPHGEFEAVLSQLGEPFGDVARFADSTGWRINEILGLEWGRVDRGRGGIRLATSKSGHGRLLPLRRQDGSLNEIGQLIERRW